MPSRAVIAGAVVAGVVAVPQAAWAQTSGTTPVLPPPAHLWIAPVAGGVVALVVVLVAIARTRCWRAPGWWGDVTAPSAWDAKDSWVTNLTAVGAVFTAVFTNKASSSLFKNVNTDNFTVVSLLLGGVAIMGPVVYGAFAKHRPAAATPVGTRVGLLLATLATLVATFGLLADMGHFVSYTTGSPADKALVYAGLGAAALVVGVYAVRSTELLMGPQAPSLLSPAARSSATL